jgi:uncharacterized protein YkwD
MRVLGQSAALSGLLACACARTTPGPLPATASSAPPLAIERPDAGSPTPAWLSRACPQPDPALARVAHELTTGTASTDDPDALTRAVRLAGGASVWPRAWVLSGESIDAREAEARLLAWLAPSAEHAEGTCGVFFRTANGRKTAALVVATSLAKLGNVPSSVRSGTWLRFDATLLLPAASAKLVALGPTGRPQTLPTSLSNGRVSADLRIDRPGPWLLQLLVDAGQGPVPALEWLVLADPAATQTLPFESAPGEDAARAGDGAAALAVAVAEARRSESLDPLERAADLDRLAVHHARAMMHARRLAHDVGDGDPVERSKGAGIAATEIGENVAHAATLALAHRALWFSPSHRLNLLGERWRRMGVGIALDADGSVWVTELFATGS